MSHSKSPPSLPQVVDEAGDSSRWLPLIGVFVFVLIGLSVFAAWSDAKRGSADPAATASAEDTPAGE